MRENKFKVWCHNKNEWEKDMVIMFQDGTLGHFSRPGNFIPLKPETHTAVFYTGLKDKNGVEVFEKDIVSFMIIPAGATSVIYDSKETRCVVEYMPELAAYYLVYLGVDKETHPDSLHSIGGDVVEIIGNIYENPELLKS